MDKNDEAYLKKITHHTPNEIRKGKNVINQKNLFDFFISMRISLQKVILNINSLPQGEVLKKFTFHCDVPSILKDFKDVEDPTARFQQFSKSLKFWMTRRIGFKYFRDLHDPTFGFQGFKNLDDPTFGFSRFLLIFRMIFTMILQ